MPKVLKKLLFDTSFSSIGNVNSGFAKVKVLVMTHAQVANGTKFTKETINKRINGLDYLPVIGEFKEEDEDFGTHGGKLEITEDDVKYIDTTRPYGVVMANTARWENIKMKNGETTEYLTVEAFLWIERYPELNALYEGKLNNQSMEINVLDGAFDEESWVYIVKDFEFSALCLLGKDIEPAFHEARVEVEFEKDVFTSEYQKMMFALNKYLEKDEQSEVEDLGNTKSKMKDETKKDVDTDETVKTEEETEKQEDKIDDQEDEEVIDTTDETEETEDSDDTLEDVEEDGETDTEETDYQSKYEMLLEEVERLNAKISQLEDFKKNIDNEEKVSLIETYKHRYLLSDKDIEDVVDNIQNYSKHQIEEKLCTIVVKGKRQVEFSAEKTKKSEVSALLGEFTKNDGGSVGVQAILKNRRNQ